MSSCSRCQTPKWRWPRSASKQRWRTFIHYAYLWWLTWVPGAIGATLTEPPRSATERATDRGDSARVETEAGLYSRRPLKDKRGSDPPLSDPPFDRTMTTNAPRIAIVIPV